jgi:HlyD family secretion protein
VVGVDNEEGLLLPGMTASLDFIIESANDVVLINNSALRFRPNEAMAKQVKPILVERAKILPDSLRDSFLAAIETEEALVSGGFRKSLPSRVNGIFYEKGRNKVDFDFVKIGITTGLQSEVTSWLNGEPLTSDVKIINGIKSKQK